MGKKAIPGGGPRGKNSGSTKQTGQQKGSKTKK